MDKIHFWINNRGFIFVKYSSYDYMYDPGIEENLISYKICEVIFRMLQV